ncbi:MAG: HD domain-containing protein [Subdoligranulum sp.]|jgi:HD superfamily phosphohydrolase-like protein|nr:HD domain-containing protein [Subdoligranulum sp.]
MKKGMNINDSVHGLVRLTAYEKKILCSPEFNRLHDVYQNSTVFMTFPANRTKRFEHSIGCMYLASEMFYRAVLNSDDGTLDTFFSEFGKEMQEIQKSLVKEKIANVIESVIINQDVCLCDDAYVDTPDWKDLLDVSVGYTDGSLIPYNLKEKYRIVYLILIQSLRAAALLHDVGHPPFSHIVESAINKAKNDVSDARRLLSGEDFEKTFNPERLKVFENALNSIKPGSQLHEKMGFAISRNVLSEIVTDNRNSNNKEYACTSFFEQTVMLCTLKILSDEGYFKYVHAVIDASLDCDRLDYVVRDYRGSGINAGDLDYKRIFNELKLFYKSEKSESGKPRFCIPAKAIGAVENFLKKRCNLYMDVIYHHRVIKTDMLLEDVVYRLILKYLKEKAREESSGFDRRITVATPDDISGLWTPLTGATRQERAEKLTQWNDSWLMVLLRRIYYRDLFGKDLSDLAEEDKIIYIELTELLRNVRQFNSMIKRREDYNFVNMGIACILKERRDLMRQKLKETINRMKQLRRLNEKIPNTLILLDSLTKDENSFNILNMLFKNLRQNKFMFDSEYVKEIVRNACRKFSGDAYVKVVFKTLGDGLSRDANKKIYFYGNDATYEIEEISEIKSVLEKETDSIPAFYFYVAPGSEDKLNENKGEALLQLGKEIGTLLADGFDRILDFLSAKRKRQTKEAG